MSKRSLHWLYSGSELCSIFIINPFVLSVTANENVVRSHDTTAVLLHHSARTAGTILHLETLYVLCLGISLTLRNEYDGYTGKPSNRTRMIFIYIYYIYYIYKTDVRFDFRCIVHWCIYIIYKNVRFDFRCVVHRCMRDDHSMYDPFPMVSSMWGLRFSHNIHDAGG